MDSQNLTPEQIEKARACKTGEELTALAEEVGVELSDEELDGISGGSWASDCPKEGCSDYREPQPYEKECPQYSCYSVD